MGSFSFSWVNELQKGDHPIVDESGDAKKVVDLINLAPAFPIAPLGKLWPLKISHGLERKCDQLLHTL